MIWKALSSKFLFCLVVVTLLVFSSSQPLFAQVVDNVYNPGADPSADNVVTLSFIENIFSSVLGMAIRLIGIAVFIMIVYGGITYLFSGGSKEGTAKARSTITWAVGGLAAVFLAWFVLLFLSRLTGNPNLLQFDFYYIPQP